MNVVSAISDSLVAFYYDKLSKILFLSVNARQVIFFWKFLLFFRLTCVTEWELCGVCVKFMYPDTEFCIVSYQMALCVICILVHEFCHALYHMLLCVFWILTKTFVVFFFPDGVGSWKLCDVFGCEIGRPAGCHGNRWGNGPCLGDDHRLAKGAISWWVWRSMLWWGQNFTKPWSLIKETWNLLRSNMFYTPVRILHGSSDFNNVLSFHYHIHITKAASSCPQVPSGCLLWLHHHMISMTLTPHHLIDNIWPPSHSPWADYT